LSRGSVAEIEKPVWIDWIALYSALSKIWTTLNEIGKEDISDYMRSSRLRDSMEIVGGEDVRPEQYEKAFEAFIIKVFGSK